MAHGKKEIKELVLEYTDNSKELEKMIRELYPLMTGRKLKNRSSRIIKRLEESAAIKDVNPTINLLNHSELNK